MLEVCAMWCVRGVCDVMCVSGCDVVCVLESVMCVKGYVRG